MQTRKSVVIRLNQPSMLWMQAAARSVQNCWHPLTKYSWIHNCSHTSMVCDWHSSLNRGPLCTAGWSTCLHHRLASLCGIILMCSLQIMPCSRVLRPLTVANVPNPHVFILQQRAPAVRPALKDSNEQGYVKALLRGKAASGKASSVTRKLTREALLGK